MSRGSPARTGFFLPRAAPLHDPGWGHPEHQGRLRAVASAVEKCLPELHDRVQSSESDAATIEQLVRVHPVSHLEGLKRAAALAEEEGTPHPVGPETPLSGASWRAVEDSAGAAIAAVERVARGELRNAFVATRPPGHHASANEAMGFCAINHVAVATRHLQAEGLAERVAIVDWDAHHGNGTQNIFYADPDVYLLSLHQMPLFPGTGAAEETGEGPGRGRTLNVPLSAGLPRERHRALFGEAVTLSAEAFEPDFILVSAGYDALKGDPLAGLLLEPEDFLELTEHVMAWANAACGGRIVALLEGGYEPKRTGAGVAATVRRLAGVDTELPAV